MKQKNNYNMHYISKILIVAALLLVCQNTLAQPPSRKKEKKEQAAGKAATPALTERAKSQYPGTATPEEVDWKREVYRVLDLTVEKNASLYYPVEPSGKSMNLFTLLFNNILNGNITAYKYNLDGYESFTEENVIVPKEMLDNYRIYYEEQNNTVVVGNSDIPSAEVLSYFIKECHYYDQRSGTYGRVVTAICPVLHRSEEFSSQETKYPMFWLNYEEIAPYLAQQTAMTSSLNNVSTMSLDDYFKKGCYDGEIYKTVNVRNLAIAQYCKDSAEIRREQEKVQRQIDDFRANLWSTKSIAEMEQDSIAAAAAAASDTIQGKKDEVKKSARRKAGGEKSEKKSARKKKEKSESGTKAARVSVRRTRR